jgi:hypothetical protein
MSTIGFSAAAIAVRIGHRSHCKDNRELVAPASIRSANFASPSRPMRAEIVMAEIVAATAFVGRDHASKVT